MVGKLLEKEVANRLLGRQIGLRDQIEAGFFADGEAQSPVLQDGGTAPGCFLGGSKPIAKRMR